MLPVVDDDDDNDDNDNEVDEHGDDDEPCTHVVVVDNSFLADILLAVLDEVLDGTTTTANPYTAAIGDTTIPN